MKSFCLILIFMAFSELAAAQQLDIVGIWTGRGSLQTSDLAMPIAIQTVLKVEIAESKLNLKDCWTLADIESNSDWQCQEWQYRISNDQISSDQIFSISPVRPQPQSHAKEVGRLFPWQILIYDYQSAFTHQLTLQLLNPELSQYLAVSSNKSGVTSRRISNLIKASDGQFKR